MAAAWRNPGRECSLGPGEQAGLEEAPWMTPSALLETQPPESSWRSC